MFILATIFFGSQSSFRIEYMPSGTPLLLRYEFNSLIFNIFLFSPLPDAQILYDLTDLGNSYCVPNPISPNNGIILLAATLSIGFSTLYMV